MGYPRAPRNQAKIAIYKEIHEITPLNLPSSQSTNCHETRQNNGPYIINSLNFNKLCYQYSLYPRTIREWNMLPPNTRAAPNVVILSHVKSHWATRSPQLGLKGPLQNLITTLLPWPARNNHLWVCAVIDQNQNQHGLEVANIIPNATSPPWAGRDPRATRDFPCFTWKLWTYLEIFSFVTFVISSRDRVYNRVLLSVECKGEDFWTGISYSWIKSLKTVYQGIGDWNSANTVTKQLGLWVRFLMGNLG